jgi:hypothetical protein
LACIGCRRLFEANGLFVGYPESPTKPITVKHNFDRDAAAAVLEFFLCHRFHLQIQEDSILNLLDTSPEIHGSAVRPRLYDETFIEIERAKLDLLRVSDSIATARRDFFENGVSTSAEVRSARDAEQRRLEILVQSLKIERSSCAPRPAT